MSKKWNKLKGADLSGFAASQDAQQADGGFLLYLRKHGRASDIHTYINNSCDPVEKCMDVFPFSPHVAQQWFINTLNSAPNADTNFKIALHTVENIPLLKLNNIDHTTVFNCIDFSNIPPEHCEVMFRVLVEQGEFDLLRTHWETYKTAIQSNPEDNVIYAAERCLDIRTRVQWSPQTSDQKERYFTACCVGGLIARAKECKIAPSNKKLLRDTLLLVCLRNPYNDEALQYLLDEYPKSQWFKEDWILNATSKVSSSVRQKIVQHFHHHAPTFFNNNVVGMIHMAVQEKNMAVFDDLFAYISPDDFPLLMRAAVHSKNTKALTKLLKQPNSSTYFAAALNNVDPKLEKWANDLACKLQNATLRKEVQHHNQQNPRNTQRKM